MVALLNSVRIGPKLIGIMVAFVSLNVAAMSTIGYTSMQRAVEEQSRAKLEAVAMLQAQAFEDLLESIDRDLRVMARTPMVAEALVEFSRAYAALEDPAGRLQADYIDANPHPLGQKDQLLKGASGSAYDAVHERFHPTFDNLQDEMGFYESSCSIPGGTSGSVPRGAGGPAPACGRTSVPPDRGRGAGCPWRPVPDAFRNAVRRQRAWFRPPASIARATRAIMSSALRTPAMSAALTVRPQFSAMAR